MKYTLNCYPGCVTSPELSYARYFREREAAEISEYSNLSEDFKKFLGQYGKYGRCTSKIFACVAGCTP